MGEAVAVRGSDDAREWPGIDPIEVRLALRELDRLFSERVAHARSGGEKAALVEEWAVRSLRELRGVDGAEARELRAVYRAIARGGAV